MYNFDTHILANKIWKNANPEIDLGMKPGMLRGYCIEVLVGNKTNWLSCEYIEGDPNEHFNSEFYNWYYSSHDFKPTGRICFRGYGIKKWDEEAGEYVEQVHFIDETFDMLYKKLSDSIKQEIDNQKKIYLENDDFVHYNIKSMLISKILNLITEKEIYE